MQLSEFPGKRKQKYSVLVPTVGNSIQTNFTHRKSERSSLKLKICIVFWKCGEHTATDDIGVPSY
jgi:hypothetical protein